MVTPSDVDTALNKSGWSQAKLAQHIGVDVKTLGKFVRGHGPINKGRVALEEWTTGILDPGPDIVGPGFVAEIKSSTPSHDVQAVLATASDLDLIAALTARLSSLRNQIAHGAPTTGDPAQDAALLALATSTENQRRAMDARSSGENSPNVKTAT